MAAFQELHWHHIDAFAIAESGGLATIEEQRHTACRAWLARYNYSLDTLDCTRSLDEIAEDLQKLLQWETHFGYVPGPGLCGLDTLRDGFLRFEMPEGGRHVLELIRVDLAWERDPKWVLGMLSIAQEYSRWQLALGRRFFALLVVAEHSAMIGTPIQEIRVPSPFWTPYRSFHQFES
jgi:hypothetical protein